ncbi:MAG: CsbD family protein [Chloroflexales bacterium]|nr:CsbD family protein [Chloroflexales bacterium]
MSDNNEEKLRGTGQDIKGKVKEAVGNVTGDAKTANEGRADQVVGQGRVENAKAGERVKGAGEQVKGAVKGAVGALTGDEALEAEGKADDLKGKARQKTNQ